MTLCDTAPWTHRHHNMRQCNETSELLYVTERLRCHMLLYR